LKSIRILSAAIHSIAQKKGANPLLIIYTF
jgi:hypothetical protein